MPYFKIFMQGLLIQNIAAFVYLKQAKIIKSHPKAQPNMTHAAKLSAILNIKIFTRVYPSPLKIKLVGFTLRLERKLAGETHV